MTMSLLPQPMEGTLQSRALVTLPVALAQLRGLSEPRVLICEMESKPFIFSDPWGEEPCSGKNPILGPSRPDRALDALPHGPSLPQGLQDGPPAGSWPL